MAGLLLHRSLERVLEKSELPFSSDHRGVEPSRVREDAGQNLEQPMGPNGLFLALDRDRPELLGADRVARKLVRRLADQDLSGRSGALEALGDVHRVARDERGAIRRITRDHLAAVHPHPHRDRDAERLLELDVQPRDRLAHLDRGANGAQRVVLVEHRDAEDGHDGISDELLDRPTMPFERRARHLVVARHDLPNLLRVLALPEARGAGQVAEQDRDGLPRVEGNGFRDRQGAPARPAEAGSLRIVLAAPAAGGHGRSVRRFRVLSGHAE